MKGWGPLALHMPSAPSTRAVFLFLVLHPHAAHVRTWIFLSPGKCLLSLRSSVHRRLVLCQ